MSIYYPHALRVFSQISGERENHKSLETNQGLDKLLLQVLQFMTCRNVHVDIRLDSLIGIVRI